MSWSKVILDFLEKRGSHLGTIRDPRDWRPSIWSVVHLLQLFSLQWQKLSQGSTSSWQYTWVFPAALQSLSSSKNFLWEIFHSHEQPRVMLTGMATVARRRGLKKIIIVWHTEALHCFTFFGWGGGFQHSIFSLCQASQSIHVIADTGLWRDVSRKKIANSTEMKRSMNASTSSKFNLVRTEDSRGNLTRLLAATFTGCAPCSYHSADLSAAIIRQQERLSRQSSKNKFTFGGSNAVPRGKSFYSIFVQNRSL